LKAENRLGEGLERSTQKLDKHSFAYATVNVVSNFANILHTYFKFFRTREGANQLNLPLEPS